MEAAENDEEVESVTHGEGTGRGWGRPGEWEQDDEDKLGVEWSSG